MTFKKWKLLFNAYKKMFDKELLLTATRKTYEEVERPITIDDVIPF